MKSFTCRSLIDQSSERKRHISESKSQKTLFPGVHLSTGKNIREAMNKNMLKVFSQRGLLVRKTPRLLTETAFTNL